MRAIWIAILALLIAPASAHAGGFATVGLSSTPETIAPGELWLVELTILQHGRADAPMEGLQPGVIIRREGGERRRFEASPTGRPGVYRARVVFPSAGVWRYRVDDDFVGAIHSYPPVMVREAARRAGDSGGGPNVGLALLAAAVAGLGAGFTARAFG
jgi:hypothetical protein